MIYSVLFAPEAEQDLRSLYLYIADRSGPDRALSYVESIEAFCQGFSRFPMRGTARDDLQVGARVVGFRRRLTLVFHLEHDAVVFDRVLYAGRNWSDRPKPR